MTYAIGQIIYGVDLQAPSVYDKVVDDFAEFRDEMTDLDDMEVLGSEYNGSGEQPLYMGANLGEIDVCETIKAADLLPLLTPTEEQRADYLAKLAKLKEEATPALYDKIAAIEPYVFITWGSS